MLRLCLAVTLTFTFLTTLQGQPSADELLTRSKGVLAQLDGELTVPGLKAPVEVIRDRWGVPHIYAKSPDDLFFAQGFVAAQDRLFQIDMWRRLAVGETAEVVGKAGIVTDRVARLLKYRGDLEPEWASYGPDTQQIATAFTRGINAYIDQVGDKLPIEFQILGVKPGRWQAEDILGRMSGIVMTRNFTSEIPRAELIAKVGLDKARLISPTDPLRPFAPAAGLDLAGITKSVLDDYNAAIKSPVFKLGADGSNNWVVDGTLSASGQPLLASDPHRTIALPSLRYLVHLNAPGWNVIGGGEPALPGVAIGHNDNVAWGFTIVGTDQSDIYVEETDPADSRLYKVGDQWQPMKIVKEKIQVKGRGEPVELELRFTRHGPVLHQDEKTQRAYALKWVGSEPGAAAYLGSLALDRAKDANDFVSRLPAWKLPSENMVYADKVGNIGWVAAALTPVRQGSDGLLPVPGAAGKHEWQGFRPFAQLPQLHNPPSHFVMTANQKVHHVIGENYPHEVAYEFAPPYRFNRLLERFKGAKRFTLDDFKSMQHDNVSIPGRTLAKLLKSAKTSDAALQPFIDLLAKWDGDLNRESQAGPLYGYWLQELNEAFYRPHVPKGAHDSASMRGGQTTMLNALEKPSEAWFGADPLAGRDRLLLETLATAVKRTQDKLGADVSKWSWGRLHQTPFRHPLAELGPEYAKAFNLETVPRAGDGLTPNAAGHNPQFEQISGASYRHLFDLSDWDKGLATSTPGQSAQPGSPFYGDLLKLWAKDEYFPLVFSRRKVEEVAKHRLVLKPKP